MLSIAVQVESLELDWALVEPNVGNKIEINRGDDGIATIKFTQPVLIQKLKENHTPIMSRSPKTPAMPGSNLCKDDGTDLITIE